MVLSRVSTLSNRTLALLSLATEPVREGRRFRMLSESAHGAGRPMRPPGGLAGVVRGQFLRGTLPPGNGSRKARSNWESRTEWVDPAR